MSDFVNCNNTTRQMFDENLHSETHYSISLLRGNDIFCDVFGFLEQHYLEVNLLQRVRFGNEIFTKVRF